MREPQALPYLAGLPDTLPDDIRAEVTKALKAGKRLKLDITPREIPKNKKTGKETVETFISPVRLY